MNKQSCNQHFLGRDPKIVQNSRRAFWVLVITFITMLAEIYFGIITGSMALLADGWHMATHAAALGITYFTYRIVMNPQIVKNFNFGGGKLIPLGGFASSVFLFVISAYVVVEAALRFIRPIEIHFNEALTVAALGLAINIVCAVILRPRHTEQDLPHSHHSHSHGHHHHSHGGDHNIASAYLHVIADATTSVAAIIALLAGKLWGLNWLDPVIGIISSLVIVHWALGLIRTTGWELLDGHAKGVDYDHLKMRIESLGASITDLHVWRTGPDALVCELIVHNKTPRGIEAYRTILHTEFAVTHSVIEERP